MVEDSPALEDDVDSPDGRTKRKAQRSSESPDLKRKRKEPRSGDEEEEESTRNDDNEDESERHDNGNTKSGSEDGESSSSDESESDEDEGNGKDKTRWKSFSSSESASSSSRESSASPERKEKSPERERSRKRSESPKERRSVRKSGSPRERSSVRKSPSTEKRRSPDRNRRDRSRDRDRRRGREDSRDRRRDRSRERDRNSSRDRDSRRRGKEDVDMEEGEVKEAPKPLSKREIERLALLKQLEEEESLLDKFDANSEKQEKKAAVRACPYLDTIDRSVLDFDFEKLCSVSLSTMNVYACMICGKYYQGRGQNTHAYTHSLDVGHHVYLNLQTLKFYCLPDNYEILDPSLEDIKYVLKPSYTKTLISTLDKQTKMCRAFDDSAYYPGIIGLNNIKANDYCNVVLHALSHVIPLRNYFLQEDNYINLPRPPGDSLFELPKRFGELMRKLWNPRAFRKHVSPHEMLQAAVHCSEKRFQITEQSDAADFMTFLLNTLHSSLNGTGKTSSSIIYKAFRGKMREYSRKIPPAECTEDQAAAMLSHPSFREVKKEFPFLYLSMDLPPPPLYRDSQMENVIPQIPLTALLSKFNGQTEKEYKTYKDNIMKRFEILRLPEYLIVSYKRFTKNQFFVEKNPTIVNFPITNVDMYEYLAPEVREEHKFTTYDLIANIVHDGAPNTGTYRAQILHQGSQKWFQMEDLHVEEILPQVIVLAEAYIQVWRLNRKLTREQRMNEEQPEGLEPMPGIGISNPFNPVLPPKVKSE